MSASRSIVMRLLPVLAAATLLGCHGSSSDTHPTGVLDGSASPDASGPLCPATVPALGTPCTASPEFAGGPWVGLYCEYGDAWWSIACDTVVVCDESRGQWTPAAAVETYAACGPQPGPNPASCPSGIGYGDRGMPCPDAGLTCYYGPGASCLCVEDGDAGAIWSCQPDEPGCPTARPRVGSPCTTSPNCFYGNDGFGTVCVGGVWQLTYYGTGAGP
jgi:hypothetical protein